ncbi:MAG TPA: hypothetical protein VKA84_02860 [Gemmatimonadaceae bacterium]|nr:hypothetical protein [Gemmatimonadaceae bacterium]
MRGVPRSVGRPLALTIAAALPAALLVAAASAPLLAQQAAGGRIPTACEEYEDPHPPTEPLPCEKVKQGGFKLFGLGDNAVAGLKTAIRDMTFAVASSTPGDRTVLGELPVYSRGTPQAPTTNNAHFFEYHFWQTAALGDWQKAKATIPSLGNVIGGGYAFQTMSKQYGGPDMFTGKDGTLGTLFEGVQSAAGSCLDQSGSFLRNGLVLLAISDCPQTWPGGVWRGSPYFSQDSYVRYRDERVGRTDFTFDFWKIPSTFADPDRQFIGTSAQTYAISSDHGRETRASFGKVVPKRTTADPQPTTEPIYEGYPMGLDWSWDAMTFDVGSVARMQLLQIKIINNSKEVYGGNGIDYDSLYVGFQTRWLHAPPGNGRRANVHVAPEYGAVVSNELGGRSNCDNGVVPFSGAFFSCTGVTGQTTSRGFVNGATGVMYLKSPIGDLRNKLFSNPSSAFYDPTNPHRGDTITFNRMSMCGFVCSNVQFVTQDARKAFGTLAAREADALDGRNPNGMTDEDYWYLLKPYHARGTPMPRVDISSAQTARQRGGFNYCVPGNWRYTNRPPNTPAGPDTLFFDQCNPTTNKWLPRWPDTTVSGEMNMAYNNSWSGMGPFPLKAGDTTGLVVAIVAAPDSQAFEAILKDAYDFYLDFYLGPGVPNSPRIRFAAADSGVAGLNQTRVTLYFDYTAVNQPDPSIANTARKLRNATPGSAEAKLVALNPWLPDSIERKAPTVVDTVFIFKSCNGGITFTATQTKGVCPADRALDNTGKPVGVGWQAYSTLARNSSGSFPATFSDASVTGGQKYLYVAVAKRPALTFTVRDTGLIGGDPTPRLITRTYTALPPASATLSTNRTAPNVEEIYVPVSAQAGSVGPRVTATVRGTATPLTYHSAAVTTLDTLGSTQQYTVFVGDSLASEIFDSRTRGGIDSTIFRLYRSARVGFTTATTTVPATEQRLFRDVLTFRANVILPVSRIAAADLTTTETVLKPRDGGGTDTILVTRTTDRRLSAVVASTATSRPLFASTNLTGGTAFQPAEAIAVAGAPPLRFSLTNRGNVFAESFWTEPGFSRLRAVGTPSVTFVSASSAATGAGNGDYALAWRDAEYGPDAPFTISLTDPASTDTAFNRSLRARVRADSTRVTAEVLAAINTSLGTTYVENDLVKVYLPFTVQNLVTDTTGAPVTVAALRASLPRKIQLGSGVDTLSVSVDTTQWVPGMPLIFIENVAVADTSNNAPVVSGDTLQRRTMSRVTFRTAMVACTAPRATCNPVVGPGATGHVEIRAQQALRVRYYNPFTSETQIAFSVEPAAIGLRANVTRASLDAVTVVPNPYVVQTSFEQGGDIRRLMFAHVPPAGVIRVYTASGSFVQQITWTPEMLNANGDLFWDMRTREGFLIGAGLYLFTVEATRPHTIKRGKPGRFIIIR